MALALDVEESARWDAYEARVAKLPKRDRRELSRASAQTVWVMEATRQWFEYYGEYIASLGLPRKNVLHDAGLMIPRAPIGSVIPMAEPSELAAAVEKALPLLKASRRRVLIRCEKLSGKGMEAAAHDLHMSLTATARYLKEARQSLADILRGMGWKVPAAEKE